MAPFFPDTVYIVLRNVSSVKTANHVKLISRESYVSLVSFIYFYNQNQSQARSAVTRKSIWGFCLRLNLKNSLGHFVHHSPKFYRCRKCKIWPRFSTAVDCKELWFRYRATFSNFVVQRLLLDLGVLTSQLRCYVHSIVCHTCVGLRFDMPLIKRILIDWTCRKPKRCTVIAKE